MNKFLATLLLALAISAHASGPSRGPHGGIAAGMALQASRSHASANAQSSGNGGSTRSVVDDFQPWPEAEMRQFQKPRFEVYKGD